MAGKCRQWYPGLAQCQHERAAQCANTPEAAQCHGIRAPQWCAAPAFLRALAADLTKRSPPHCFSQPTTPRKRVDDLWSSPNPADTGSSMKSSAFSLKPRKRPETTRRRESLVEFAQWSEDRVAQSLLRYRLVELFESQLPSGNEISGSIPRQLLIHRLPRRLQVKLKTMGKPARRHRRQTGLCNGRHRLSEHDDGYRGQGPLPSDGTSPPGDARRSAGQ
ncbi:uncharacterized protein SCHCODRAFT_01355693 [Schizophyllum commune H4-8]|uniref:Uncharacterized protein n=1 Tax=Schizophyllum commune (strain H4-8 / FGSC 9210) TaxID=578458 RepID=D8QA41_SCHCM|nr:uncharacterized protein SCHCODRAFT_01355693 [Schizophyllum commune H4-8]KAI5890156.1 hypothetical protein SCHCODRAFT_01355693 [Schizophyllum commune H4-8]